MASYSIRTDEVDAVAQELATATRRLATSLENLHTAAQRFREANRGQAIGAFADAQHQWTQGHQEMTQALAVGQQRLQEILNSYLSADSASAGMFSGGQ
jgi:uncharacterized protein YukE